MLADLCTPSLDPASDDATTPTKARNFFPYPNKSSFNLGSWQADGVQKSKASFKKLIKIVSHPSFSPGDVRSTQWDKIDEVLASNTPVGEEGVGRDDEEGWEDINTGWRKEPIKIQVPFDKKARHPGPQEYIGPELHYRSLVEVIREKMANTHDFDQFHLEPYELRWKASDQSESILVHGELYTSKSFIDAHRVLQESPAEPGCDLPRVVTALMFWSDVTQLTSFGNAKAWPCYMYFGNESKYRRCRPSCHLANHVAYFEKVSVHLISLKYSPLITYV